METETNGEDMLCIAALLANISDFMLELSKPDLRAYIALHPSVMQLIKIASMYKQIAEIAEVQNA
ncbi:hypothetical protein [Kosakonia sp. 1610]|uniref:hypothetical protein n=1 Tax=Kosakonia sp. 1610 TaxID=3156426 RepID=UPI003D23DC08